MPQPAPKILPPKRDRTLIWWVFFFPGSVLQWWEYMTPRSVGGAFGTSRRLRSRFFQLLASLAFYAVVIYVLVSLM